MDLDPPLIILLLLVIGATAQVTPKLCGGAKQREEEEVSARSFPRLGFLRPGFLRGNPHSADPHGSPDTRPGDSGLLHGSGAEGSPDGGYGIIHGGGDNHILSRNRIFGQGVGLKNNSLSQKIGNLLNHQSFGILSGNSLNVNRTNQNNSGPNYHVFLPGVFHHSNPVGGHAAGGGAHGGSGGGLLNHIHRPHPHLGGSTHQGAHLPGLLGGHHHSHSQHSVHPLVLHLHHGSHGHGGHGGGGLVGIRPGHHLASGGLPGANHLFGGGGGLHHGKPGGLTHGGVGGVGPAPGMVLGHRPHPHGTLGLVHGILGNQGVSSSSGGGAGLPVSAAQPQQHHGGLLGLLQNSLGGSQGLFAGGVGGSNHITGGPAVSSGSTIGHHGLLGLIQGVHGGVQGGGLQTVTSSELKPGHVYLHLGQIGGQASGTSGSSFQSIGGSSGQIYGNGGGLVFTQSGQGVHGGQLVSTGNTYQTGLTSGSQIGQFQSQHNLHQGALSQSGGASEQQQVVASNSGGYVASPGQQQYQGYVYETQWSPHPVASTATATLPVGAVGIASSNLNGLNQVSQGSNSYAGGSNIQSSYGSQNGYEGNHLHGSSQSLANEMNYNYNAGQTVQPAGIYGFSSGSQVQVVPSSQQLQGNIAGGTSTQHSHQSSSSSSFNTNSSSQNQESTSQQSYFSGSLAGSNGEGSGSSTGLLEQSSGVNYVDSNQITQQNQIYGNSQIQSAGAVGGQYNGNYASTSSGYPTLQSNQYTNHQTQGHYPQGSVILVLQQAPLADEEIFTSGNEATLSGSSIGSGNTDNIYSNTNSFSTGSTSSVGGGSGSISSTNQNFMGPNSVTLSGSSIGSGNTDNIYSNTNSFSTGSTSSVGGGSGSISSTNHNFMGPSSVTSGSEMKYGGVSAAALHHSGDHSSTSTHSLSTSENVQPTSTISQSINVSPSTSGNGYQGSSGSSYNSQYSQPNVGLATTQSVGSTSQYYGSGNTSPPHVSSSQQGNTVLSSGMAGTNENKFSTVNKESSAGVGGTSASSMNSWHSEGNGLSTGSSYGQPAVSSQTHGVGQYGSTGSVSTSSDSTGTTHGIILVPAKITSTSMMSNQEESHGVGQQAQSFSSSVGTKDESTGTTFNGGTQSAMFSAQSNSHGQYGFQGVRDKPSTISSSTNYASSGVKEQESLGSSFMSSQRPPNKTGQQSSTLTTNTGTAQHNQILASSLSSSSSASSGGSGTTNTHLETYHPTYENNVMLSSNTASPGSNIPYQTASGSSGQVASSVESAQQLHTYGSPSYSSGSSVGGGSPALISSGTYTSTHGNNAIPSTTTSASGSQAQAFTASGNSEHTYGSNLHGGSGHVSVFGGEHGSHIKPTASVDNKHELGTHYNTQSTSTNKDTLETHISNQQGVDNTYGLSSTTGQYSNKDMISESQGYQSSMLGSNQHTGSQSVSFISSNTPSSSTGSSEVDSTHSAVSTPQIYGVSSTSGHHTSSLEYGNQVPISGVPISDKHSALSSENLHVSGVSGTSTVGSQSVSNTSPEIPAQLMYQSGGVASQTNSEVNKDLNTDHVGSGSSGQISNQYLNSNQFGVMTATYGESGNGNQVSGSAGLDDNTYSHGSSSSYQSGPSITDNKPGGSISPSYGGTTSYLVSSSSATPHQAPAGFTQDGTTQAIGSNTNEYNSMLNAQGHFSGGLMTGSGINKDFTGSAQSSSFRYPGQYSFKYGYVPPNNVYTNVEYPGSSNYEPSHIVYNGHVNPDIGLNGYYYHYSTVGSPSKERIVEKYPVQTVVEELSSEPDVLVNSVQNGRPPLLINVDEEDGEAEEDQNKNVVKGSLQGHFEHSGGGSFEGSVSRPFSGGVSFTGNHELSTGISGGVSGHLGNVGNFQGFLGNAANRVGGIISGVGHAVGIIRDGEVSVSKGGSGFEAHDAQSSNPDSRTQSQRQTIPAPVVEIQEEFQQQNPSSN